MCFIHIHDEMKASLILLDPAERRHVSEEFTQSVNSITGFEIRRFTSLFDGQNMREDQ